MIDLDDLAALIKSYRRVALVALGAMVLAVILWLFHGHPGSKRVNETMRDITRTTETNERRADAILDAAKQREEAARHETNEKMAAVSDDDLPDLLDNLLREWRSSHKNTTK